MGMEYQNDEDADRDGYDGTVESGGGDGDT